MTRGLQESEPETPSSWGECRWVLGKCETRSLRLHIFARQGNSHLRTYGEGLELPPVW